MPEKEYKSTEEVEAKEGYIKDFSTNRLIRSIPEEQVRQIMLRDWFKNMNEEKRYVNI